jgi:glutathione S-transferase
MKLYDYARAPNPRRTRIFMAEKGITCETEQVDIFTLQHFKDEYVKLNPLKRVPSLELDDGTVITESQAICRYFEALQPNPPLFGVTAKDQGSVEMWSRRIELGLFSHIGFAFRHGNSSMSERENPQVPAWAEASIAKIPQELEFLNAHLKGRDYIATDHYTMADINLLCALDFLRILKLNIPDNCTDLKRVHTAFSARPSAKA